MIKLTKRKGFNFFRSYYDVFNELEDADKLAFIKALLDKQFLGVNPTDLKGMAKFAWISQTNSIDSQVKGYEDKTGVKLTPTDGGSDTPTGQVEGKGEVQVEGKEQLKEKFLKWGIDSQLDLDKVEDTFLNAWDYYEDLDWKNKNDKPIVNLQSTIRKVWFKDLSKFKKEIKIDLTVLMAAQQIPAQMQSLMDKHKVSEQYLRDLYASRR